MAREITDWWAFYNAGDWNHPHDPILALWIIAPELFKTTKQTVVIDDEGYTDALAGGKQVLIVTELDPLGVTEAIVQRIEHAGSSGVSYA